MRASTALEILGPPPEPKYKLDAFFILMFETEVVRNKVLMCKASAGWQDVVLPSELATAVTDAYNNVELDTWRIALREHHAIANLTTREI